MKTKNKKIFWTFGDRRLRRSLDRIRSQVEEMCIYDEIYCFSEDDLGADLWKRYRKILSSDYRGFGYWVWKPYLFNKLLKSCTNGDIVHYSDCGCWFNSGGRVKLADYFNRIESSSSGILAFCVPSVPPADCEIKLSYPEWQWTKADLFAHFGVEISNDMIMSEQIMTTSFIVRKQTNVMRLAQRWMDVYSSGLHLVNDEPSLIANFPGFTEHRHDQSVFSLLAKMEKPVLASYYDMFYPVEVMVRGQKTMVGDWGKLASYPIWAKRDKDIGGLRWLVTKIENKVIRRIFPFAFRSSHRWGTETLGDAKKS